MPLLYAVSDCSAVLFVDFDLSDFSYKFNADKSGDLLSPSSILFVLSAYASKINDVSASLSIFFYSRNVISL